jgi:hypothetical protein
MPNICCRELEDALQERDSGFTIVESGDRLLIHVDLGGGSYINTPTCVFCEKEPQQAALKLYLRT